MTEGSDLIRNELENQALYVLDGNAQENRIERIDTKSVSVAVGNEKAFSFYQRLGFSPQKTVVEQIKTDSDCEVPMLAT